MRFLQKINIYLYLFILAIFTFIFFTIPTNALVNNSTQYELTMPNYDELFNWTCGNENLKDVIDDLIENYDDTYFNIVVLNTANGNFQNDSATVWLFTKNTTNNFSIYGSSNKVYFNYLYYPFSSSNKVYRYSINSNMINCSNTNITDSQVWTNLLSAINTGVSSQSIEYEILQTNSSDNSTIDNTTNNTLSIWHYYSNIPFIYKYGGNVNSNGTFYKSLYIVDNDTTYTFNNNETVPSYYDLYHSVEPDDPTFIGYQDSLKTTYTNLNVSDISNYNLKLNFKAPQSVLGVYQEVQDYVDSTSFDYICSGRINNSNYYTYESFACSLNNSYTINDNIIEYTFNNLTFSQNTSNYDKIFVTIKSNFLNNDFSSVVFDLNYTYSLGSFYNTDYKGAIYDNFDNLPLNFKVYFSSNNSNTTSKLYVKDYNFIDYGVNYIGFSNTSQQQNLIVGESILGGIYVENGVVSSNYSNQFVSVDVTNNIDTGIMIYQQNSSIPLPSLKLFFNSGIVVSFNNTSSDDFYYVDSTGNITHGNFIKPLINSTANYDISYYISQVNNFINGLSADSLEFATLTQNFYNNMPTFFQTFIFVVFILFCVYFTYLLIKKW